MVADTKGQKSKSDTQKDTPKERPKEKKAPPSAAELREQWTQDIISTQAEADKLDVVRGMAESKAKAAKKNHEAAVERLQELIRRGPDTQLKLDLQDQPPASGKPSTDQAQIEADWNKLLQATPIKDVIPLTEKELEKLSDAGVKNVFDFEQLRGGKLKEYPDGLRSLPRVGEATVDKWEDAMMVWLKQHQPKPALEKKAEDKPQEKAEPKAKKKLQPA